MNEKQEAEWIKAQNISIGEDLIEAAQKQLEFLAAVDRQRWLYSSPGVERAIYRYKACWLPLLAKYSENGDLKDRYRLVVPLDCEWIWHCHRLNPVQYKMDCERVYGRILDYKNVESSVRAESKDLSRKIWTEFYPDEPFELEYSRISSQKCVDVNTGAAGTITYDLVAAVQRQSSFYYQVSRPFTQDPRFLAGALARYKGFLYLIKSNQEKSLQRCSVPTYDIDIMWHSHQLYPVSYCKDLTALLGEVLQHDDTDSDRSVGKKLHNGFDETTEQFEETFGLRYWRAGAMYQGSAPTPLTTVPIAFDSRVNGNAPLKSCDGFLSLPPLRVIEVFLEIVDVKNAEIHEGETLYVSFTKKQPDIYFSGDGTLSILSLTGKKNVACFDCEPMGDLNLTLIAKFSPSSERVLGTTSISLEELTAPNSKLSIEKWFQLNQNNKLSDSVPIYLRVAVSSTLPLPASLTMNMIRLDQSFPPSLSLPLRAEDNNASYWTSFVDVLGNPIVWVQIRDIVPQKNMVPEREVIAVTKLSMTPLVIAVGRSNEWSFTEASNFSFTAEIKGDQDGTYDCELKGDRMIKLYWGKRLEYQERCCESQNHDCTSITAVEFSDKHPYGKAIATFDKNSKIIKVNEEWFILPWASLSLVFMDMQENNSNGAPDGTKCGGGSTGNLCFKGSYCSAACVGGCLAAAGKKGSRCFGTCVWSCKSCIPAAGKTGTLCGAICLPEAGKKGGMCFSTCVDGCISTGTRCMGACLREASEKGSVGYATGLEDCIPAAGKTGTRCMGACLREASKESGVGYATCLEDCIPAAGKTGTRCMAPCLREAGKKGSVGYATRLEGCIPAADKTGTRCMGACLRETSKESGVGYATRLEDCIPAAGKTGEVCIPTAGKMGKSGAFGATDDNIIME